MAQRRRLTKKDLKTVRSEVYSVAVKWYDLGLELGISPDDLDVIKVAQKNMPTNCLLEVLKQWLSGVDPFPTWKALVTALCSPAIGEQQIAQALDSHYCKSDSEVEVCTDETITTNARSKGYPESTKGA